MNLLFVNSTRRWGGVKSWTLRCAASLSARGHQVIVAGRRGDPFLDACRDAGLDVRAVPFGLSWSLSAIARFVGIIRRGEVQVVVCNTGRDLSTAGAAARLCGVPVVHRVGNGSDFRDTWVRRRVHAALVTRVLAPAQVVAEELTRNFPWIRPEDVAVSWNAAAPLPARGGAGQADRIACLSRLARGKGLEALLEAAGRLRRAGRSFQLDMVGEGPLEAELREQADRLGLGGCVRFPGFLRPDSGVLSLAAIGVLPSLREGFPNTLVEYWAAGLAVVASDLPGVREALDGTDAAVLVPPGDAEALAEALAELLADEAARGRLAGLGRRRADQCFTPATEGARLEAILAAAVAQGSAPRRRALPNGGPPGRT